MTATGQRLAEALVDTMAECEVSTRVPADVEAAGVGEYALVVIGGDEGTEDAVALGELQPADHHVMSCRDLRR